MDVDNNQQSSDGAARSAAEPRLKETRAVESLARRRALFKGLGKGGAVLTATVPIHTLAGQTLLTAGGAHQCSVSGMHSGVHSAATNAVECGGRSRDCWGDSKLDAKNKPMPAVTWPTLPKSCTYKSKCSDAGFTVSKDPTLFDVMKKNGSYVNNEARVWICAWLNALYGKNNFPYSDQQVMAFYKANDRDALTFFKTYTENINS